MRNANHMSLSMDVEGVISSDTAEKWLDSQSQNVKIVTCFKNGKLWQRPVVEEGAFVDDTARLLGGMIIKRGCYIGPYAVIRLDEKKSVEPLVVDENSNIQDGAIVHSTTTRIGKRVIVAHQSIIHGAIIEDDVTIYIQAVVDGAGTVIGKGSFLHRGAYVGKGIEIPPASYLRPGLVVMTQKEADSLPTLTEDIQIIRRHVLKLNQAHVSRYLKTS